MSATGEVK